MQGNFEFTEDEKKQEAADAERVEAFVDLTRRLGWQLYRQLITKKINDIADAVLMPELAESPKKVSDEYLKGTINGLRMSLGLIQATVDEARREKTSAPAEGDE